MLNVPDAMFHAVPVPVTVIRLEPAVSVRVEEVLDTKEEHVILLLFVVNVTAADIVNVVQLKASPKFKDLWMVIPAKDVPLDVSVGVPAPPELENVTVKPFAVTVVVTVILRLPCTLNALFIVNVPIVTVVVDWVVKLVFIDKELIE